MSAKKAVQRHGFKTGEHVVYPAHGVGQIMSIEEQEIAGFKLELFVVTFDQEKMTLRVPTAKAASVGMRKLSESAAVDKALVYAHTLQESRFNAQIRSAAGASIQTDGLSWCARVR